MTDNSPRIITGFRLAENLIQSIKNDEECEEQLRIGILTSHSEYYEFFPNENADEVFKARRKLRGKIMSFEANYF
jgi:hypothetical protein